jgi:pimeloyl-ACP methyl ester carboxylesterase
MIRLSAAFMTPPQSHWPRRLLMSLVRIAVAAYLGIILFMAVYQRQLLFLPEKMPMDKAIGMAADQGLSPWTDAAGGFLGWRRPAGGRTAGSVLIVHGNGGSALGMAPLAQTISEAANLDACLLEYPGYGPRGGAPTETSLLAAADQAFETLPANRPVYVVSESLGTGVAAHLAQKYPARVAGMVMFVPYDRLASVAQNHYPFLPAYFLLRDRFAPLDWMKDYRGPVKIVIAGADEVIPPGRGQKLYDAYPGPKSLQIIPGARHNDAISQSPEWWREVAAFWHSVHEQ